MMLRFVGFLVLSAVLVCASGQKSYCKEPTPTIPVVDFSGSTIQVESWNLIGVSGVRLQDIDGEFWGIFRWNAGTWTFDMVAAGEKGVDLYPTYNWCREGLFGVDECPYDSNPVGPTWFSVSPRQPTNCDPFIIWLMVPGDRYLFNPAYDIQGDDIQISGDLTYHGFTAHGGAVVPFVFGPLAVGQWNISVLLNVFGGSLEHESFSEQITFSIADDACDTTSGLLYPDFTFSNGRAIDNTTLEIHEMRVSGFSSSYWARFQWNPSTLTFDIKDAGAR